MVYTSRLYDNRDYIYHHGVLGQKWGVRRYRNSNGTLTMLGKGRAKKAARLYYKAQNSKMNAEDSVTARARKKSQKEYEKNMKKYDKINNEIGEENVNWGKAKVSKFRRGASRHQAATLEFNRKAAIGSAVVGSMAGTGMMLVGVAAINPKLIATGAGFVSSSIYTGVVTNMSAKTIAPSVSRTRKYYSEEYEKTKVKK